MMSASNERQKCVTQPTTTEPTIIRKYPNRRLYDTNKSSYATIDDLGGMVRSGVEFSVIDSATGQDLTRVTLLQIMLEIESEGHDMLPVSVLRMLIPFYGTRTEPILARYLERVMRAFNRDQRQAEDALERSLDDIHKAADGRTDQAPARSDEISELRAEFTALKAKLDKIA